MEIKKVTDAAFRKYGKVVENVDFTALVEELEKTPCTAEVVYEPSVPQLEALPVYKEVQDVSYGEMPIQIGFCNGNNYKLNALEYHRTSEIDVAASDLILLLGWQADIGEGYKGGGIPASQGSRGGAVCNNSALCALQQRGRRIPLCDHPSGRNQSSSG